MAEKPLFYTDVHIPYPVIKQLREKGVDVLRCQDIGMDDAKDIEHLTYAAEHERTVITCDFDFVALHYRWIEEGKSHFGIIYCHQPQLCTIKTIIENVLLIYEDANGKAQIHNVLWRVQK